MHLIDGRSSAPGARRTDTFTGEVRAEPLAAGDPAVNLVSFAPRARTFWHRHAGGQLLVVSHGRGLVVAGDGHGGPVEAGQSVWTPPGEVHWHGAGPDHLLVHTAYSFGVTEWLHEVGEQEYADALEASW